jgi:hypothetical protein
MIKKKVAWEKVKYGEDKSPTDGIYYYGYYGKEELGSIYYYEKWKKWVWEQCDEIVMSVSCLKAVLQKMEELENGNV